jgi:hypothetical protein
VRPRVAQHVEQRFGIRAGPVIKGQREHGDIL